MGKNGGGGGERGESREESVVSNTMRDIHLTCRDARLAFYVSDQTIYRFF
jgi:hypothetical protein